MKYSLYIILSIVKAIEVARERRGSVKLSINKLLSSSLELEDILY